MKSNNGAFLVFGLTLMIFTAPIVTANEIVWLTQNSDGVIVTGTDSGETISYPGSYQLNPTDSERGTVSPTILVYTDDWLHTSPNTLVEEALTLLGLTATIHVNGDYAGFETALTTGGPWDIVIWSGENNSASATLTASLLAHVQGGGSLAATYWRQLDLPADPLWAEMGFSYISNYVTPPPVFWWDPAHPIFTVPEAAPEWQVRVQNSGTSQGTNIEPLANGLAIAGYTATAAANEASIVVRDDGKTIYKAMRDVSTDEDADGDLVLDGIELWENIITALIDSVPVELMTFTID